MVDRRAFLGGVASAAILGRRAWADEPKARRLPLSFSTLGCPGWPLTKVLEQADVLGYAAVELRGIEGDMDLPARPELRGDGLAKTLDAFAARGLRVASLDASAAMHEPDPVKHAAALDEGKRFIDLAASLHAPFVRVFGDRYVEGEPREKTLDRIVAAFKTLGLHARGKGVSVLIESHGDFTDSPTLARLLSAIDMPEVGLLWDAHHTFVAGKEAPSVTWAAVGRYVRHTHIKDSRPAGSDRRYVLMGQGDVPLAEQMKTLVSGGYQGLYSLEWEKKWHPEIEEPEVAFPQYVEKMKGLLQAAGMKA